MRRKGTKKRKNKQRNKTLRIRTKVSGGSNEQIIQINARKSRIDPDKLLFNTVITSHYDTWWPFLEEIDDNIKAFGIQSYINRKHNEYKPVKTIKQETASTQKPPLSISMSTSTANKVTQFIDKAKKQTRSTKILPVMDGTNQI